MNDHEDNFRNLIGGAFGQVEASVGPEAYQAHNEVTKTVAECNRAQAKMIEAQIETGVMLTKAQVDAIRDRGRIQRILTALTVYLVLLFLLGIALPFMIGMWQDVL